MRENATDNENPGRKALRADVEKCVVDGCRLYGPAKLDRAAIVTQFANRGVSTATLYRWISACLNSPAVGRAMQALLTPPPTTPADEARRAAEVATKAGEAIAGAGVLPSAGAALAPGLTLAEMVGKLRDVIELGEKVAIFAQTPDGKIRMAKTALAGGAAVRDGVLAYAKLLTTATEATNMLRFIDDVVSLFEKVGRQHPQVGELIAPELMRICKTWGVRR